MTERPNMTECTSISLIAMPIYILNCYACIYPYLLCPYISFLAMLVSMYAKAYISSIVMPIYTLTHHARIYVCEGIYILTRYARINVCEGIYILNRYTGIVVCKGIYILTRYAHIYHCHEPFPDN